MIGWLKSSGTFGVCLGFVFLASGLVINIIQLFTLILLWPFSKKYYRLANAFLVEIYWTEMCWCAEWWAGVKVKLYGKRSKVEATLGKDRAIILCNHRSDVDWLFGWVVAEKYGCLGGAKALMKGNTRFLPVLGWSWWFLEYIFLARNWEKDQSKLSSASASLHHFPMPFWIVIFAEGTRFTEEKHAASQAYAKSQGMEPYRHLLVPKTKGFAFTASCLKERVDKVYDVTFAFPPNKEPNMMSMLQGKGGEVHILIETHDIKDAVKSSENIDEIQEWARKIYRRKDDVLEYHAKNHRFEGDEWEVKRHVFPLAVMSSWCLLFITLFAWYVYSAIRAGETTTLAIVCVLIAILFVLVRFLINFSKANKKKQLKKKD